MLMSILSPTKQAPVCTPTGALKQNNSVIDDRTRDEVFTGTLREEPLVLLALTKAPQHCISALSRNFLPHASMSLLCSLLWWTAMAKVHMHPGSTTFSTQGSCRQRTHSHTPGQGVQPLNGNRTAPGSCPRIPSQKYKGQKVIVGGNPISPEDHHHTLAARCRWSIPERLGGLQLKYSTWRIWATKSLARC